MKLPPTLRNYSALLILASFFFTCINHWADFLMNCPVKAEMAGSMGGYRQVVTKERHGRRGNEGEDRTTMIGSVGHGPRSSRCSDKEEGVEWLSTDGPVGGKPLASGGGTGGRCRAGLDDHPLHTNKRPGFLGQWHLPVGCCPQFQAVVPASH